jgi:hypothetical protein
MASITCKNGVEHKHTSVFESKVCWGIIKLPPTYVPSPPVTRAPIVKMVTESQLSYIERLGGDLTHARKLTCADASKYIDQLKARPKEEQPMTEVSDPRVDLIRGMMPSLPTGYYAVGTAGDDGYLDFIRISEPKTGKFKGSLKIQSQHGDKLVVRGAYWKASQKLGIYDQRYIEPMLLLLSDHFSAAIRYGKKLGHCIRCNAELTDEESRRVFIGPECRKIAPGLLEEVEARLASGRL